MEPAGCRRGAGFITARGHKLSLAFSFPEPVAFLVNI